MKIPVATLITPSELNELAHAHAYELLPPHNIYDALVAQADQATIQEIRLPPKLRATIAPLFNQPPHTLVPDQIGMFIAAVQAKHVVPLASPTNLPPFLTIHLKLATPVYQRIIQLKQPAQINYAHATIQRILDRYKPILPPHSNSTHTPIQLPPIQLSTSTSTSTSRSSLFIKISAPLYQHYLDAYHAYRLLPPRRPPSDNYRIALTIDATFSVPPLIPSQEEIPNNI